MNEYTDIMKNLFLPVLLVAGSFFVSCTSAVFTPTPSANPWDDNYLSVAKMEDYRQWGTYNVHDPSCRKLGDYYYMYSTDAIFGENRKEAREKGVPLGFIQMRRSKDLVIGNFWDGHFPKYRKKRFNGYSLMQEGKGRPISGHRISSLIKINIASTIAYLHSDVRHPISDLPNQPLPKGRGRRKAVLLKQMILPP